MSTLLEKDQTAFVLVDVQGKLSEMVHDSELVLENLEKLIQGLLILDIPIIWLEQYPEGLGGTNEQISKHLTGLEPIGKRTFNACNHPEFLTAVKATGRRQLLVAGIEAHICVYQTALGLKSAGYDVQVVADASSSRTASNKHIGFEKLKHNEISLTSVEMLLYELLGTSEGEQFKKILRIIK
ncbi:hydrolase [Sporosarcina siberiensis]|uniref:Hydrolase n=1 Tax=Sporosarcina siberiensis TaxID=1365606 RepID=A0ABW4SF13_9BACL